MLVALVSATNAACWCVDVQRGVAERNIHLLAEECTMFRFGITVGDIIRDEKVISGDGVNMAARPEALARRATRAIIEGKGRPARRCGPG